MKAWQVYVTELAERAWTLDAHATGVILRRIEDLIATDELTDAAVAEVLYTVGVPEFAADLTAPSIRGAAVL